MPDDPRAAPQQPRIYGLLAVCALVFGGALLFVVRHAGDAGDRTLPTVVGLASVVLAIVLGVAATFERGRH